MRSARLRLLFAGGALALTLAVGGGYFLMQNKSLGPSRADLTLLSGVWRSQGYGWLWVIEDGRLRTYDASGTYCVESGDARRSLDRLDKGFKLSKDGRVLRLALDDPAYQVTFERVDALPEACASAPARTPPAVIDALDQIFSAHYAFFEVRKIDWRALIAAAKSKVNGDTSEPELLQVVRELFSKFDDNHVSLKARVNGKKVVCDTGEGTVLKPVADQARLAGIEPDDMIERWNQSVWTKEIEDDLMQGTARTTANGNIKYGLIDGDIGFLSILSMVDFDPDDTDDAGALDEALDEAIALFEDAKAVIVDVSINDGGEDVLARRIASRFADKRTLVYSKYAGDSRAARPQAIYLEPSDRRQYTGPVYLLTSNVTVSAAEIFTMAMRALSNVTHAGQATRGALSDELTKRLPNGWRVTLSNEIYLDAAGKAWEGAGVPPKLAIPVFKETEDAAQTHLQAVRAVVDHIRLR